MTRAHNIYEERKVMASTIRYFVFSALVFLAFFPWFWIEICHPAMSIALILLFLAFGVVTLIAAYLVTEGSRQKST